jgi:hypothetical protein
MDTPLAERKAAAAAKRAAPKTAKKAPSPWLAHVKSVKAAHPGKSLKDILVMAKSSYTK